MFELKFSSLFGGIIALPSSLNHKGMWSGACLFLFLCLFGFFLVTQCYGLVVFSFLLPGCFPVTPLPRFLCWLLGSLSRCFPMACWLGFPWLCFLFSVQNLGGLLCCILAFHFPKPNWFWLEVECLFGSPFCLYI